MKNYQFFVHISMLDNENDSIAHDSNSEFKYTRNKFRTSVHNLSFRSKKQSKFLLHSFITICQPKRKLPNLINQIKKSIKFIFCLLLFFVVNAQNQTKSQYLHNYKDC